MISEDSFETRIARERIKSLKMLFLALFSVWLHTICLKAILLLLLKLESLLTSNSSLIASSRVALVLIIFFLNVKMCDKGAVIF